MHEYFNKGKWKYFVENGLRTIVMLLQKKEKGKNPSASTGIESKYLFLYSSIIMRKIIT